MNSNYDKALFFFFCYQKNIICIKDHLDAYWPLIQHSNVYPQIWGIKSEETNTVAGIDMRCFRTETEENNNNKK